MQRLFSGAPVGPQNEAAIDTFSSSPSSLPPTPVHSSSSHTRYPWPPRLHPSGGRDSGHPRPGSVSLMPDGAIANVNAAAGFDGPDNNKSGGSDESARIGVEGGFDNANGNNNNAGGEGGGGGSAAVNLLIKFLFYACAILQVVIWPSVMTITFIGAIALDGLFSIFTSDWRSLPSIATDYAVLFLHGRKMTLSKYVFLCIITVYMLLFFVLFVAHEKQIQPVQTSWLHPSLIGKYTFSEDANTPFAGVDVGGEVSKHMRSNPFVWPRTLQRSALLIANATILGAGPGNGPLSCNDARFDCYSTNLAAFTPPSSLPAAHSFVPLPAQFYTADAIVTPPAGKTCSELEIYRININHRKNVEHALDYPASASAPASSTYYARCNLFGYGDWCLQFQHSFTPAQYNAKLATKCALSEGASITIRLPIRALDVHPSNGLMSHDILLVPAGAQVRMRWEWHDAGVRPPLLEPWKQVEQTASDKVQTWRDSSESEAVFFKFAIAVTPLLILWYHLAVTFSAIVVEYQILMTCLFVLMPSALLFLTVGAWLPMAGCIVCVVAIIHTPTATSAVWWGPMCRHALLFITAVCNSVQFVWLLVLVQEANYSAFFYHSSLRQLADSSSQFIISADSPTWVGLLLPVVLLVNFAFLLGSAICVAMEVLTSHFNASQIKASAASA